MRISMSLMAGALAVATIAAPAAAAPTTVSVSGTVTNGYDAAGIFGAAGASLAGLPFSAIFTIDRQSGDTAIATPALAYLYGAGSSAPVTAALTIGTGTYDFAGTRNGSARAVDTAGNGGTDALHYMVEDAGPAPAGLFYVGFDSLRDLLAAADYGDYGTIALTAADNAKGYAQIGGSGANSYAELSLDAITSQTAGAVPEPATWMMMVAGFALAGTALRRPRARVRFAA